MKGARFSPTVKLSGLSAHAPGDTGTCLAERWPVCTWPTTALVDGHRQGRQATASNNADLSDAYGWCLMVSPPRTDQIADRDWDLMGCVVISPVGLRLIVMAAPAEKSGL